MALSARFSLLHSDLNDFLFASLGDEQNGMPLNVVSALTRLGADPWKEAARLATLAPMIGRLPISRLQLSDNLGLSQRLVELLPARGQAASLQASAKGKKYFPAVLLLACLALGAAALFAMLWSGCFNKGEPVKYPVPPIVIPVLLLIGIAAYAMLRPPIIIGHPPAAAASSQSR